jgi:hypothetical protein
LVPLQADNVVVFIELLKRWPVISMQDAVSNCLWIGLNRLSCIEDQIATIDWQMSLKDLELICGRAALTHL